MIAGLTSAGDITFFAAGKFSKSLQVDIVQSRPCLISEKVEYCLKGVDLTLQNISHKKVAAKGSSHNATDINHSGHFLSESQSFLFEGMIFYPFQTGVKRCRPRYKGKGYNGWFPRPLNVAVPLL